MICAGCNATYIGETNDFRFRMNNAKKDIRKPTETTVPYASHINKCTNLIEPYFKAYPLLYENDTMQRKFKEWRLIKKYSPPLNKKL